MLDLLLDDDFIKSSLFLLISNLMTLKKMGDNFGKVFKHYVFLSYFKVHDIFEIKVEISHLSYIFPN